jgi:hypothetical protein
MPILRGLVMAKVPRLMRLEDGKRRAVKHDGEILGRTRSVDKQPIGRRSLDFGVPVV